MFEVGFTEIVLILGLALLVLGPEKLPGLAQKVGRWTGRARAMARQLRTQLEQEVTLDELAKSRPTQSPPPAGTATAATAAAAAPDPVSDPASNPPAESDPLGAGHRTGPQEAQPYTPPDSGLETAVNGPVSDIEPPPAESTETATAKDGQ